MTKCCFVIGWLFINVVDLSKTCCSQTPLNGFVRCWQAQTRICLQRHVEMLQTNPCPVFSNGFVLDLSKTCPLVASADTDLSVSGMSQTCLRQIRQMEFGHMAQNRLLWRLLAAIGETHLQWCKPEMMMMIVTLIFDLKTLKLFHIYI